MPYAPSWRKRNRQREHWINSYVTENTLRPHITTNWLVLLRETTAVCCGNHWKHITAQHQQNGEFCNVTTGGTHSYHCCGNHRKHINAHHQQNGEFCNVTAGGTHNYHLTLNGIKTIIWSLVSINEGGKLSEIWLLDQKKTIFWQSDSHSTK
jgi:hypothetical protein